MSEVHEALKYADFRKSSGIFLDEADDCAIILAAEVRRLRDEINGLTGSLDRAEKALKEAQEQEPAAFWWIGPDGKDNGGPYRGKPSDAAIDNARNMGCEPVLLYARPVPAVTAVAAPAVPTDEQIHAAYRKALGQSIRERDMPEIRKFARALLQSVGEKK